MRSSWRTTSKDIIKPLSSWKSKFPHCKKLILKHSNRTVTVLLLRGEEYYRTDTGTFCNVFKEEKNALMMNTLEIKNAVTLKPLKLRDVNY